ncbi:MAG: glycosyltransferase family 39 protein [Planctomycetota bacterium]
MIGFATLSLLSTWEKTATYDEPTHLAYGRQAILQGTFDRHLEPGSLQSYNSKMPVSILNAAVSVLLDRLPAAHSSPRLRLLLERMPTVLWGILGAIYIFLLARRFLGTPAASACFAFYLLEPNVLAHSSLITTDAACMGFFLAALYHFQSYLKDPDLRHVLVLGIVVGMAQAVKYTCLILLPILGILFILRQVLRRRGITTSVGAGPPIPIRRALLHLLVLALVVVLLINLCFAFEGTLHRLPEEAFDTQRFDRLDSVAGPLLKTIVAIGGHTLSILPLPYLQGLAMVLRDDRAGPGPHVYVLGRLTDHGVPWYYLVIGAFKIPLPLVLLLGASLVLMARRRFHEMGRLVLFLLIPAMIFFLYFSIGFNTQLGVRYILPVIPIVIVIGVGYITASLHGRRGRWLVHGLLGWQALSTLLFFPHYIAYTNELLIDKKYAYRLFCDSNLQWGQDEGLLRDYITRSSRRPLRVEPGAAVAGTIIVGVNELVGESHRIDYYIHERYAWLRDHFTPIDRIAHSYLIYEVAPEALIQLYDAARRPPRAGPFPRPITPRLPPWAEAAEPVPRLSLQIHHPIENGGGEGFVVNVKVESDTPRPEPWNLWFEEILKGGDRQLVGEPLLLEVGRGQSCFLRPRLSLSGRRGGALHGWIGIFPDRVVASAQAEVE